MAVLPCACGTPWRTGMQRLVHEGDVPYDEHDVTCPACGASATFRFDVSSFFDHAARTEAWARTLLPDADPRVVGRIVRKVGPPFGTKFQGLVQNLAKDGDLATLLYLGSRIEAAVAAVRATPEGQ